MNAKVNSYIVGQIESGTISGSDLDILAALYSSGGLTSIMSLEGLPPTVQQIIRDAFRNGVRWSFMSLIPWVALEAILFLFLSKIPDGDVQQPDQNEEMRDMEGQMPEPSSSQGENMATEGQK
ncbi:hypothetical protein AZE42_13924 [Rhizopogon vesiculosus]|uniref:Uncharacterized protein n=1 Tax=Rhizopogon vesiculosus TaxID=180088 RepID=A0A1J8RA06_9AGAM|nr:hypothetical protein AZE42_13924 [Rhizopogon vesiculosus]